MVAKAFTAVYLSYSSFVYMIIINFLGGVFKLNLSRLIPPVREKGNKRARFQRIKMEIISNASSHMFDSEHNYLKYEIHVTLNMLLLCNKHLGFRYF